MYFLKANTMIKNKYFQKKKEQFPVGQSLIEHNFYLILNSAL